ncbi:MAG: hypothetical protein ACSLFK_03400 [Gemmatimonadaceae bacterium]
MMRRSIAVTFAATVVSSVAGPAGANAQEWNDERSRMLVEQATERRARQIADTLLVTYKAAAHGYLTFLAQVGEGFTEPPKIVKADELSLEVYWQAPNLSKQLIAGRRDTTLLPTDINYHRDHLGIVQNNFPSIIRLGDGDEVRDVPHPLSADGLTQYDYAIRDSLQIRLGPRALEVYEVRVRPKDDREPRAVGAVYIDRESGEVVRMAFSFTRAALRDRELEDVSVVLENGLIEGLFWLPRRQEIEIRRTGKWLDYPARGIIRGRWEICCYEVNRPLPPGIFRGPEISLAPPGTPLPVPFIGEILDSLPPEVRAVTDADVAKVQEEARALVRGQALARVRGTSLAARSISDFLRVNRVEGFAIGAGATRRLGEGFAVTVRGRYGFSDEYAKGRAEIAYRRASGAGVSVGAFDDYLGVGEVRETSQVISSIAAQEFGSDFTDLYGSRGFSFTARTRPIVGWTFALNGASEKHRGLAVNASPARGEFDDVIAAANVRQRNVAFAADRPTRLGPLGFESRFHAGIVLASFRESGDDSRTMSRFSLRANMEKPVGKSRIVSSSVAAWIAGGESVPPQNLVFIGGPTTAPGYDFHQFAARSAVSQRLELQLPVPFAAIPLGRYGRAPASITLAPFVNAAWIDGATPVRQSRRLEIVAPERNGWHPSVGVGALALFDLLRFDVARGLRDGRWTFNVDVSRDFWGIL